MSLPGGQKVVAFDFDGVLHEYHGWNDGRLGKPIPGMRTVVDILVARGVHVVVHTTRNRDIVRPWLLEHGFPPLDVYNDKWKRIDVFVDDRAVQFHPNLAIFTEYFVDMLLRFEPHWRQEAAEE